MLKIYVAGAYSSDNVLTVFANMRRGIRMATRLFMMGYAPFCPWLDFHFCLSAKEEDHITVNMFYQYSLAWLRASDAVLVLPGFENSKGTLAEIQEALDCNIPVFYSVTKLEEWRKENS